MKKVMIVPFRAWFTSHRPTRPAESAQTEPMCARHSF
jgi:hypothetical protein